MSTQIQEAPLWRALRGREQTMAGLARELGWTFTHAKRAALGLTRLSLADLELIELTLKQPLSTAEWASILRYSHRHQAQRAQKPAEQRRQIAEARRIFSKASRDGLVSRKDICEFCGLASRSASSIIAHHDDHSRPLDVLWLCRACHSKLHASVDAGYTFDRDI